MRTDFYKLVDSRQSRDNTIITDLHMTCQCNAIHKNDMVSYDAIVRDVHISHDKAVLTDHCFAIGFGSAIDGYTFAYRGTVAYLNSGVFTLKL